MHLLRTSTFVLFSTCLAQVLAHRGGNSTEPGDPNSIGNDNNGNDRQRDRNNGDNSNNQAQISVSTVTVTAANAASLTVMTVSKLIVRRCKSIDIRRSQ